MVFIRTYRPSMTYYAETEGKGAPRPDLFKPQQTTTKKVKSLNAQEEETAFIDLAERLGEYYQSHIAKTRFEKRDVHIKLVEKLLREYPVTSAQDKVWIKRIKQDYVLKARLSPYLIRVNHEPRINSKLLWYFYTIGTIVIGLFAIAIYQTASMSDEDLKYIEKYMKAINKEKQQTSPFATARQQFNQEKHKHYDEDE